MTVMIVYPLWGRLDRGGPAGVCFWISDGGAR